MNKEIIDYLLDNGADIKHKDAKGNTILHWAVLRHSKEIIINYKDIIGKDIKNNNNETPLDWAKIQKRTKFYKYFE